MPRGSLFVYGTLLDDRVVAQVLGTVPASQPASLSDYRRFALAGRTYPGIRYSPGATVEGRLLRGLSMAQLRKLDRYEGSEYRRQQVHVRLPDGRCRPAWVYVVRRLPAGRG